MIFYSLVCMIMRKETKESETHHLPICLLFWLRIMEKQKKMIKDEKDLNVT